MRGKVIEKIEKEKIIAIVRGVKSEKLIPFADGWSLRNSQIEKIGLWRLGQQPVWRLMK